MKRNEKKLIGIFALAAIFLGAIVFLVMAQLGQPSTFYGAVRIDGNPAPIGTLVRGVVNSINTDYYLTQEGLYVISVEGGNDGDTIQFYVDGQDAGTGIFNSTIIQEKDLDVGTPLSECNLYSDWRTKDTSHSLCSPPYEGCVRKDGTTYYNKACCNGNIVGISKIT